MTTLTAVPATPAICVRYPGFRTGELVHPEGICQCFHGGPAPVRTLSPLDERLRDAALAQTAAVTSLRPRRVLRFGRRAA